MPVEAEIGADSKVARDVPITVEPKIRDDASALVVVEIVPHLDQGGEGDLSVLETISPIDKGKGVATSRGEQGLGLAYRRKHGGQRPSKGLLSPLTERSREDPTS